MKLLNDIKSKLRSTEGFSLAEQLISVIFIGLLCVVIAAGLGAAISAHSSIANENATDQLLNRSIQEINDELAYSISVEVEDDKVTFLSASTRTWVTLETKYSGTNEEGEKGPLEGIALVGQGVGGLEGEGESQTTIDSVILVPVTKGQGSSGDSASSGLGPIISDLSFNEGTNIWTYTIQIVRVDAPGVALVERIMHVARNA